MAGVLLRRVSKRFGDVHAVRDLDLEVRDREFLVLVGPSGCGKSTTLRMVAGLERATSGEIYIGDRRVDGVPPKDRDIAMVYQNYALYPHMDVYGNMAFGLRLRGVPPREIDRRVREAADALGLADLLGRRPRELSGGQQQRVALGRAIVRDPQVFLMDEPLSNLDPALRVRTRTELARLHRRLRTTVIYVTHDQTEAMTLSDRIVVMKDGLVQQVATPQEIYERPANLFVAGFIGTPPMNFLRCRVEVESGAVRLEGPGLRLRLAGPRGDAVAPYAGRDVIVGVRPEDLRLAGAETAGTAEPAGEPDGLAGEIAAQVDVVEPTGSETYAYLSAGGHSLAVRLRARAPVREGDRVRLVVPAGRLRVFDPRSERAVA